jgi:ribosomal protein L40E/putative methionine-R-sulfoxide reductase with GAF domain
MYMPLNWSTPTGDEQFFQSVLSAAFTIQEHNDRRKVAGQAPARQTQARPEAHPEPEADRSCEHCGALMSADASRCGNCGREELRPGESMQPNWASMWLARQEQIWWAQRSPEVREGPQTGVPPLDVERKPLAQALRDSAGPGFLALPVAKEAVKETVRQEETEAIHDRAFDTSVLDKAEAKSQRSTEATEDLTAAGLAPGDAELTVQPIQLSARDDSGTAARTAAPTAASIDASGTGTPLFNGVPNHLLQEIAQQALQATHAAGAAIALMQQGELMCRATAGDFASEIGQMINTGSGFTGACTSSGTMQLCSNTALDSRVDADACRKLGVGAIIVVPLLHQDRLRGLIAVFSRRPYAFGMRDLQALHDLAQRSAANLQLSAESANANPGPESPGRL